MILGVNSPGHDAALALVDDDGVIAGVLEEERYSRVRHGRGLVAPAAVCELLADVGVAPHEVHTVAFASVPSLLPGRRELLREVEHRPRQDGERVAPEPDLLSTDDTRLYARTRAAICAVLSDVRQAVELQHHLCHAASAFLASGFERSAVLTVDGAGELESAALHVGKPDGLRRRDSVALPHSLGCTYAQVTWWLGFGGVGGEGKTMGLAPYGEPRLLDLFEREVIRVDAAAGSYASHPELQSSFLFSHRWIEHLRRVLGPERRAGEELDDHHRDVAATMQRLTEQAMLALARRARRDTGERCLCLAGGVALNSVANGVIANSGEFEELFVQPLANDAGLALGAALVGHRMAASAGLARSVRPAAMTHAGYGPHLDVAACAEALTKAGLPLREVADPAVTAAELIAAGRVVGWFQGRAEVGPRALGGRSILADPRPAEMKDRVNLRVKNREPWRPFAPSIPEEKAGAYFACRRPTPFMIEVHAVRPEWRGRLAAVTHVDGTARVQTVRAADNPVFHRLLVELERRIGVACVLNTSFNVRGEPMVSRPREAVAGFLRTEMDALLLGPYLVEADDRPGGPGVGPFSAVAEQLLVHGLGPGRYLVVDCGPAELRREVRAALARGGRGGTVLVTDPRAIGWWRGLARGDAWEIAVLSGDDLLASQVDVDVDGTLGGRWDRALLLLPNGRQEHFEADYPTLLPAFAQLCRATLGERMGDAYAVIRTGAMYPLTEIGGPSVEPRADRPSEVERLWRAGVDAVEATVRVAG